MTNIKISDFLTYALTKVQTVINQNHRIAPENNQKQCQCPGGTMDDQEKGTQTSTTNEKYSNKISTKSGLLIFIFTNKKNYKTQ